MGAPSGPRLTKVLCEIEYPDDMLDQEDNTPTGSSMTSDINEIDKIIRDGCAVEGFTYQRHAEYPDGVATVFVIRRV